MIIISLIIVTMIGITSMPILVIRTARLIISILTTFRVRMIT